MARAGNGRRAPGNFPLLASPYKEDFQALGGFVVLCLEAVNSTGYDRHEGLKRDYMALKNGMVGVTEPIALLGGL